MLLHAGEPIRVHDVLSQWTLDPLTVGGLAVWVLLYARGRAVSRKASCMFWSGWCALLIALLSPLHALSEWLFSAHMVQHTILIAIAAPLIVLGRPILAVLYGIESGWARSVTSHRTARLVAKIAQCPVGAAFGIHSITIWVWHLPALYNAALASQLLHALQHISFFATALLFWNAILAPARRRIGLGKGVVYLFAIASHTALLGALITLAPRIWVGRYGVTAPLFGITALEDQQIAGLIMWVPAGLLYAGTAVWMLVKWLDLIEKRNVVRGFARAGIIACLALAGSSCEKLSRTDALDEQSAAALTGGNPRVGRTMIEELGCGGCHEIRGIRGAHGLVGPPLNGVGRRSYIAGVLPNTPDNMALWILNPKAVDSLTAMPTLDVTPKQARDIAAFLYTLR